MKTLFLLLLLVYGAAAVIRSLKFFESESSGIPHLPEFVGGAKVDGVEVSYYDSITRKKIHKQHWMDKVTADNPEFWETETKILMGHQQLLQVRIEALKQRFNQSGGVHMFQLMIGCEWDDETGEIDGFYQDAYDGEDFLSFDLKTLTWIAAKQQALITKHKWDNDRARLEQFKHFMTKTCVQWLKTLLAYGQSSLLRTERPSISLLQRTPSSPISCFATGFFPDRAVIFWRKDGEELHEGVEAGELLPNHDGTFQISTDLTLPEDAKDLHEYECVFQLSGLREDLLYTLDKSSIKTNEKNLSDTIIIVFVPGILMALVLLAFFVVRLYKKKNMGEASDSGSELSEKLNPIS